MTNKEENIRFLKAIKLLVETTVDEISTHNANIVSILQQYPKHGTTEVKSWFGLDNSVMNEYIYRYLFIQYKDLETHSVDEFLKKNNYTDDEILNTQKIFLGNLFNLMITDSNDVSACAVRHIYNKLSDSGFTMQFSVKEN